MALVTALLLLAAECTSPLSMTKHHSRGDMGFYSGAKRNAIPLKWDKSGKLVDRRYGFRYAFAPDFDY